MHEALTRVPEVKLVRLRTLTDMELVLREDAALAIHPYIGMAGAISHRVQVDLWRLVRHRLADYYPCFVRCGQLDTEISRQACEIHRWRITERIAALYPDLAIACATHLEDPQRKGLRDLVPSSPTLARVRDHSVEREARMTPIGTRTRTPWCWTSRDRARRWRAGSPRSAGRSRRPSKGSPDAGPPMQRSRRPEPSCRSVYSPAWASEAHDVVG